eukprot:CAMPEP_0171103552 /NCGR_PEP_ID=MMETSP0766_2-20121228/58977_1 /TAXON_ID=439317 /ORGANISM="Gambierdiscus australes, Strain CAWD 149" /LENGTH=285 /DNA_ID=CAMNT_0011563985 /DNA_START=75 /DNA_END=932 /DNA_ORIENTATION=+
MTPPGPFTTATAAFITVFGVWEGMRGRTRLAEPAAAQEDIVETVRGRTWSFSASSPSHAVKPTPGVLLRHAQLAPCPLGCAGQQEQVADVASLPLDSQPRALQSPDCCSTDVAAFVDLEGVEEFVRGSNSSWPLLAAPEGASRAWLRSGGTLPPLDLLCASPAWSVRGHSATCAAVLLNICLLPLALRCCRRPATAQGHTATLQRYTLVQSHIDVTRRDGRRVPKRRRGAAAGGSSAARFGTVGEAHREVEPAVPCETGLSSSHDDTQLTRPPARVLRAGFLVGA